MAENKELKNIKIIVKKGKTKDGKEFDAYKMVQENGKLIDLHFRKTVETSKFAGLNKFTVDVGYCQVSENFEFPRVYVGDVDYSSIVDCYAERQ